MSTSDTKSHVVSIRVSDEEKRQLAKLAKEWRRTPASLIKQWLEYVFEDYEMENSIALQKRVEESRKSRTIPAEEVYKELGLT